MAVVKMSTTPGWVAAGAAVVIAAITAITAREEVGDFLFEEVGGPQARILVWMARAMLFLFGVACGWWAFWLTALSRIKEAEDEERRM